MFERDKEGLCGLWNEVKEKEGRLCEIGGGGLGARRSETASPKRQSPTMNDGLK
jgi:hypothetical protein